MSKYLSQAFQLLLNVITGLGWHMGSFGKLFECVLLFRATPSHTSHSGGNKNHRPTDVLISPLRRDFKALAERNLAVLFPFFPPSSPYQHPLSCVVF